MKSLKNHATLLAKFLWENKRQPMVMSIAIMGGFVFLLMTYLFKDPTTFAALPEATVQPTMKLEENGKDGKRGVAYIHHVWQQHELKVTEVAVSGGSKEASLASDVEVATSEKTEIGFEDEGFGESDEGFGDEAVEASTGFEMTEVAQTPITSDTPISNDLAAETASEDGFGDEQDDGFGEEGATAVAAIDLVALVDGMKTLPGGLDALPPAPKVDADKVALGHRLYFDKRLSGDGKISCATCHAPDKGYADGLKTALGFAGKILGRHSPTVLNAVYNKAQFWDGRAKTLAEQAAGPLMADVEMNAGSPETVAAFLKSEPGYAQAFQEIYQKEPNLELACDAIAEFEATIVTPDAPFDRYVRGDKNAMTDSQKRGLALFFGKARCTSCHTGVNFTDDLYHNLGITNIKLKDADLGRFNVTKNVEDKGKFKTPTVRNAELTAPFMHDGSVATLMELVEFYDKGGHEGPNKSELLKPLDLTSQEKQDLVNFMKALTGKLPKVVDPWAKSNVTQDNSPAKNDDNAKDAGIDLSLKR